MIDCSCSSDCTCVAKRLRTTSRVSGCGPRLAAGAVTGKCGTDCSSGLATLWSRSGTRVSRVRPSLASGSTLRMLTTSCSGGANARSISSSRSPGRRFSAVPRRYRTGSAARLPSASSTLGRPFLAAVSVRRGGVWPSRLSAFHEARTSSPCGSAETVSKICAGCSGLGMLWTRVPAGTRAGLPSPATSSMTKARWAVAATPGISE